MRLLPKMTFWIIITIFQQMKYFNGNYHIYKPIYLRNWSFLSEFDTLLMYINLQTRSHIFLKISIFCKKIITFSISAHLMKKSTFLPKFQFFSHKIDTFAPKLILTETLVTLPQSLQDIILSMNLEIHSFAQKLTLFA